METTLIGLFFPLDLELLITPLAFLDRTLFAWTVASDTWRYLNNVSPFFHLVQSHNVRLQVRRGES